MPASRAAYAIPPPSADALRDVLVGRGLEWSVEGRDRLAILVPPSAAPGVECEIDPVTRRWLVQEAQRTGFSHVAIEIDDDALHLGVSPSDVTPSSCVALPDC
ncbi:MAG: hypothetical protein Q8K82_26335 [Gemmatimonadaceae bacterium]|nr:hypothetical protein [Gemmatimonadaceae bacterium]